MNIDTAIEQAIQAFRTAYTAGRRYVVALGMALWCPYVGIIPDDDVIAVVRRLRSAGIRNFYLAGSMGLEIRAM